MALLRAVGSVRCGKTLTVVPTRAGKRKCQPTSPLARSIPQRYAAVQAEVQGAKRVWARRSELPLSEVGLYAAFGAELFALFCVGEIVGRGGSITEYK